MKRVLRRKELLLSATGLIAAACTAQSVSEMEPQEATTQNAEVACSVDSLQAFVSEDVTILSADNVSEPVSNCRVDGYVTTQNPGPNQVNFRLQLPTRDAWTGRYYFIGLGGSAGYVPTDSQIPAGNPLVKGFAVAGTDTGRQGGMLDWSFLSDPAKAMDHTHRGAHVTAVATQQLTRAYYGEQNIYRYHAGCSGGGRMGGEAITRHPGDFDGVLLGQSRVAPPGLVGGGTLKFVHAAQEMVREPGAWLSPAKLEMVENEVTQACDSKDGAVDNTIWDSRLCDYDVAQLLCQGSDGPDCLTSPEVRSIKAILDGPRGPQGDLLSEPMPISNISSWSQFLGNTPPPWDMDAALATSSPDVMRTVPAGLMIATTVGRGYFGDDFDALTFDYKDPDLLKRWSEAAIESDFANSPELTNFESTGGKVLMYVGVSDPCCSAIGMEKYVRWVTEQWDNNVERVGKVMALYAIPGMAHCAGGTGPNDGPDQLLYELIDWVENDKQPDGVVMHRGSGAQLIFSPETSRLESGIELPQASGRDREFLVCPYPLVSVFDDTKSDSSAAVYESENWSCRTSRN